jgi:hypothetical protein
VPAPASQALLMTRRERQRRRRKTAHPVRRGLIVSFVLAITGVITAGVVFALWVVSTANSAPTASTSRA